MERKEITPFIAVSPVLLYVLGGIAVTIFAVLFFTNFSDLTRYWKMRQM